MTTKADGLEGWLGMQPRLEIAQTPANSSNPEERATEFVPVEGGRESTSAEALLIVAYCILWVVLFWFVFSTWKRQGQLEARLSDLDRRLERARDDAPES
jgi:CcmD family protein